MKVHLTTGHSVLKFWRLKGKMDVVTLSWQLTSIEFLRMSGSLAPFPHTPLWPVLQCSPVRHTVSILCSFLYADRTVNTQRNGEVLRRTIDSTYCSCGSWMWCANFVAEFQDAVRIFTPDLIWISTRKSAVNFVRDFCSSYSSVDADSVFWNLTPYRMVNSYRCLYINYQLDAMITIYLFIKYYFPLHVSSLKCSSSGGYSCIHAAYGTVTVRGGLSVHS